MKFRLVREKRPWRRVEAQDMKPPVRTRMLLVKHEKRDLWGNCGLSNNGRSCENCNFMKRQLLPFSLEK